ncbi:fibronectin type III domain-containing protein [Phytohabitans sp. LJ34]|uniref:fibronectin type III domain-containing protein n=1 Tax=Phytohabitans sp. LJ34 TaxID=3452217 RepID=UPI003F8BDE44
MTARILPRRPLATLGTALLTVLVVLAVSGRPARADTPLSTPGTPVAGAVTTTSASFSWTPSTGPVANYTIEVTPIFASVPQRLITTTTPYHTHTGLNPDTAYQYRVWANPQPGSGYTMSNPSGYLTVRTQPVPDSAPPTAPGGAYVSSVGTISATVVVLNPSTDNHRVAGYVVQRQTDGGWTDVATNDITSLYLRNLTPDTSYTIAVVAFDANGNRSPRSAPLTFATAKPEPYPTCKVQISGWGQYVTVYVTIRNFTLDTVLNDWRLTFTLPTAYTVDSAFSMTVSRSGDQATGTPASWNTRILPGSGTTVGFNATRSGDAPLPSGFAVTSPALSPVLCTN